MCAKLAPSKNALGEVTTKKEDDKDCHCVCDKTTQTVQHMGVAVPTINTPKTSLRRNSCARKKVKVDILACKTPGQPDIDPY